MIAMEPARTILPPRKSVRKMEPPPMSVKPAGAAFFDQWFEVTMLLERAARRLLTFLFERTDPFRWNGR